MNNTEFSSNYRQNSVKFIMGGASHSRSSRKIPNNPLSLYTLSIPNVESSARHRHTDRAYSENELPCHSCLRQTIRRYELNLVLTGADMLHLRNWNALCVFVIYQRSYSSLNTPNDGNFRFWSREIWISARKKTRERTATRTSLNQFPMISPELSHTQLSRF